MRDKNENNKNNENRPEEELILGRNPVIEALKADKLIDMIFVNPDAKGSISLILTGKSAARCPVCGLEMFTPLSRKVIWSKVPPSMLMSV